MRLFFGRLFTILLMLRRGRSIIQDLLCEVLNLLATFFEELRQQFGQIGLLQQVFCQGRETRKELIRYQSIYPTRKETNVKLTDSRLIVRVPAKSAAWKRSSKKEYRAATIIGCSPSLHGINN